MMKLRFAKGVKEKESFWGVEGSSVERRVRAVVSFLLLRGLVGGRARVLARVLVAEVHDHARGVVDHVLLEVPPPHALVHERVARGLPAQKGK